jgi:large subunit ribosomal protein L24
VMIVKRHTRPNPSKQIKGGIADKPMPMDVSNVMVLTAGGVPTRIAYKLESAGGKVRRVRIAQKGGETLERK